MTPALKTLLIMCKCYANVQETHGGGSDRLWPGTWSCGRAELTDEARGEKREHESKIRLSRATRARSARAARGRGAGRMDRRKRITLSVSELLP